MNDRFFKFYVRVILPSALLAACALLAGCGGSPASGPPETPPQLPVITAAVGYFDSSSKGIPTPTSPPTPYVTLSVGSPIATIVLATLTSPNAVSLPNIVESDNCSAVLTPYIMPGSQPAPNGSLSLQIAKTYLPKAAGSCTLRFAGAGVSTSVPVVVSP